MSDTAVRRQTFPEALTEALMPSREHHENCRTRLGGNCDCWFAEDRANCQSRANAIVAALPDEWNPASLVAENERLTAALEAIRDWPTVVPDHGHGGINPPYIAWNDVRHIWEEALSSPVEKPRTVPWDDTVEGVPVNALGTLSSPVEKVVEP